MSSASNLQSNKSHSQSGRRHPLSIDSVVDGPHQRDPGPRNSDAYGRGPLSSDRAASNPPQSQQNPASDAPSTASMVCSYQLRILQHPVRARCCGFGNKDRRAVDPPPVVELVRLDAAGKEIDSCEEAPFLVCHASLWNPEGTEDRSLVENVYAQGGGNDAADASVHAVVGSQVAIAQSLKDVDDKRKMMFLYPDLSVRLPGRYSFRFQLVDVSLGRPAEGNLKQMVGRDAVEGKPVLAVVQSLPFESYRPKQFPGMLKSTELSRRLAEQGIVEIRARNRSPPPQRDES
ncbi:uncharacterized protein SPPG_01804 [Spizellomyces punctatus DAOM BR117]|uniref:Velvet domain-containing protein n=1 Tax=Spizellomyces punctatus (strain DAOM BR117) TaxID=645134 RepID=A0A0L0HMR6_SPIPD|nr:uncharacterized protein SPPG_01804 [Spizellomyces punctatus DAOM BR117]KND02721.1 hypothetical protein SPPG_01804 [Spizellomyces punctatus DAOM BR117]|eukprot:XP_016610760.1 hypothetical protein SPPG_01804 [Spizellomyces punctatus DAOM BR117]